ncbi:hypothetical protein KCN56_10465 [Photobacterium galatheae]|uniref:hypothetical protein n=1 Tax=Photobacterium galatheae TaxID=1654360 RepID=UPI00202CF05E|nr:hypothetical protein [Photobacterium galatheae]MCM0148988.1 hypothetical protein [Photobacterium galatheae]
MSNNTNDYKLWWKAPLAFIVFITVLIVSKNSGSNENQKFGKKSDVCGFLNDEGIQTHKSKNPDVSQTHCLSDYIDLYSPDNDKMQNNIAYYVEGTESKIQRLKVVANFYQYPAPYSESKTLKIFETLVYKSTGLKSFPQLKTAFEQRQSMNWTAKTAEGDKVADIKLVYDKWPSDGYEFKLVIE